MVQSRTQSIVLGGGVPGGPQDKAKMTVVVLDVMVTFVLERILTEAKNRHHSVIKFLRLLQVRDSNVYVVYANDFDAHGA